MGYRCDQCSYEGKKIVGLGKLSLCPSCYEDYAGSAWVKEQKEK